MVWIRTQSPSCLHALAGGFPVGSVVGLARETSLARHPCARSSAEVARGSASEGFGSFPPFARKTADSLFQHARLVHAQAARAKLS